MKSRYIAAGAVLLAALLVGIINSSVSSCVPDDFGKCEKVREQVRISWLGGGGKSNATIVLASNQAILKENLLEFANIQGKSGYGRNDAGESLYDSPRLSADAKARRTDQLSLAALTAVELDWARNNLYERYPEDSLNRSRRIASINAELVRRQMQRWIASRVPVKPITTAVIKSVAKSPVAPKKPAEVLHIPAPVIPGSPDPFNAPAPMGQSVHIAPHATVWYSVSDRGRRLNIWMDADANLGLVMAVYGPDIQDVWHARPTGQGAPGEGHAYFWTGRSRFKGMWKIRITNPNDFSVPYTLTAANISDKNGDLCRDCHGIIEDEWERCEHDGSFCEDLKDDFRN